MESQETPVQGDEGQGPRSPEDRTPVIHTAQVIFNNSTESNEESSDDPREAWASELMTHYGLLPSSEASDPTTGSVVESENSEEPAPVASTALDWDDPLGEWANRLLHVTDLPATKTGGANASEFSSTTR